MKSRPELTFRKAAPLAVRREEQLSADMEGCGFPVRRLWRQWGSVRVGLREVRPGGGRGGADRKH